jgi:hypothetical protein
VFVVYGHQVERISSSGVETPVAGTTTCGSTGDGGPAADATLAAPSGLAIMSSGDLLIADGHNENVRRVRFADGTITTLAGAGSKNQLPGCIAAGGGPTGSLWPLFYITEPSSARAFRAITIQFITTRAALVRTTLSRNGQTVRSVDRTSRPGSNSVTLKRGVPAGRYTMRITASSDLANNWPDEGGTLHVAKHFQASLQVR